MRRHTLKTWPDEFDALIRGRKRHEYRYNDRGFEVNDLLLLREYDPNTEEYSGREAVFRVTYITRSPSFGVPSGYVVMSVKRVTGEE